MTSKIHLISIAIQVAMIRGKETTYRNESIDEWFDTTKDMIAVGYYPKYCNYDIYRAGELWRSVRNGNVTKDGLWILED